MKKFSLLLLFVAVIGMIQVQAQSQRVCLVEHFTQASCGPCASQNPALTALLTNATNAGKVLTIKYHTSWPGVDEMNDHNPTDVATRVTYYDVSGVPDCVLDGNVVQGLPSAVTQTLLNQQYATPSPCDIAVTHTISADYDSIYITMAITASSAMAAGMIAHVVVVEEEVLFATPPGSNGETDFPFVMKKMLPSAAGTTLPALAVGQTHTINTAWALANVYSEAELAVIGFVQDNSNKSVLQAVHSPANLQAAYQYDAVVKELKNVPATTCAESLTPSVLLQNRGAQTLTSATFTYSVNGGTAQTYNWTGSLDFFESATVNLSPISFSLQPTGNTIQVAVSNPNNNPDENTTNDQAQATFDAAVSGIYTTVYLELKTDNYGSECSWKVKNSAGATLYSGSGYPNNNQTVRNFTFDLPMNDCYIFEIKDSYGDGINAGYGVGYYKLWDYNNTMIINSDGQYGFGETTPYEITVSAPPTYTWSPANGTINVPIVNNITLTFSSAVRLLDDSPITDPTSLIVFRKTDVNGEDVPFTATISTDKKVITIDPELHLLGLTTYYVAIGATVENAYDVPIVPGTLSFTTMDAIGFETIDQLVNQVAVYPNPFSQSANLSFNLVKGGNTSIALVNILGEKMMVQQLGQLGQGSHGFGLDASNLSSGMYFLELTVDGKSSLTKVTIQR